MNIVHMGRDFGSQRTHADSQLEYSSQLTCSLMDIFPENFVLSPLLHVYNNLVRNKQHIFNIPVYFRVESDQHIEVPDVGVAGEARRLVGAEALDPVVGEVETQEGEGAYVVKGLQVEGVKAVVGQREDLEAVQVLEGLVPQVHDPVAL
jgi:hypothetical protein